MAKHHRVAVLLDGGFVKKRLYQKHQRFPSVADVVAHCAALMQHTRLKDSELFRLYWYDAPPYEGSEKNPLDGTTIDFSKTSPIDRPHRIAWHLDHDRAAFDGCNDRLEQFGCLCQSVRASLVPSLGLGHEQRVGRA